MRDFFIFLYFVDDFNEFRNAKKCDEPILLYTYTQYACRSFKTSIYFYVWLEYFNEWSSIKLWYTMCTYYRHGSAWRKVGRMNGDRIIWSINKLLYLLGYTYSIILSLLYSCNCYSKSLRFSGVPIGEDMWVILPPRSNCVYNISTI